MPTEEQTYRQMIKDQLDRIEADGKDTKTQVTYTNGKVRKIILALVLAFGLIIGMGYKDFGPLLGLILAA